MHSNPELNRILNRQLGLITRRQAASVGITRHAIEHALRSGRWRLIHPRTYATHTGELTRLAELWAGILYAGNGAALSHGTAGGQYGWSPHWSPHAAAIHVTVPFERRVARRPGISVHRSRRLAEDVVTRRGLHVTSAPRTVLDLLATCPSAGDAIALVARAVQSGSVDARVLQRRLGAGIRWSSDVLEAIDDVAGGSHSYLEVRFARLLRAHRIPLGRRQARHGRTRVDMLYPDVVVELDGRLGHDAANEIWRDMERDNIQSLSGRIVLRFGWADVTDRPCDVAQQVATALRTAARCAHGCRS